MEVGNNGRTTMGTIELANNTAQVKNLTVRKAQNATGVSGIDAAGSSPPRLSAVIVSDCNLVATDTPIGANVQAAPVQFVDRNNRK